MYFRWRGGWWQEAGLLALFVLITVAAINGWTHDLDEAVRVFVRDHQATAARWVAKGLNLLGQGSIVTWVLGLGLTLLLWWRKRRWQVFLPWVVGFVLTYMTLGPLKIWSMRDAPSSKLPNAVEFFNHDAVAAGYAMSYPSGHVVNSIVWWGVIALLVNRLWPIPRRALIAIRVTPPVVVVLTTTYLNYHWVTDGLGAITLGLLLDRVLHRFRWDVILPR